jgi:iron(III) transport system ATP-binding protein
MEKITNYLCIPRLRIDSLSKKKEDKHILSNINISVYPGEVLCLLGNSGCGKTTLLRVVAGLENQTFGTIFINEVEISGGNINLPSNSRSIGLMFQEYALFPHLTVEENIAYGLDSLKPNDRINKINKTIKNVGLDKYRNSYPHMLSGGEQQRVALARAIAPEPMILLMDEPFSGLDRSLRESIREETISILKKSDVSIILVTHDPEEAMLMGDRIVLMREGEIIQVGTSEELFMDPIDKNTVKLFSGVNEFKGIVVDGYAKCNIGSFKASKLIDGDKVDILIRDQAFNISKPKTNNKFKIKYVNFMGETTRLTLINAIDESIVRMTVPGIVTNKINDIVGLDVDERFVYLF